MATFPFELVSPEKITFSGPVEAVTLPAQEGEMMIMAGHVPFMAPLKTGLLTIVQSDNKKIRVLITGGFLDINPSQVSVLAERSLSEDEWSGEKLDAEIDIATQYAEACEDFDEKILANENLNFLKHFRMSL